MPSSITFTGNLGPAEAVTALVFRNVTSFTVDIAERALTIFQGSIITIVDISDTTTFTVSISGHVYTVTVSN